MKSNKHNVYVDGRVRVCKRMCSTCIFRSGNLMDLRPDRVEEMVKAAEGDNSAIICHDTLDHKLQAVCKGFYDRHPTPVLQIAERLGRVKFI